MSHDVVQITRSANPVSDESVAGSVETEEARRLLAAITAGQSAGRSGRNIGWKTLGVPAAVCAALAITVLAVSLVRGDRAALVPKVASPGPQAADPGSPVTLEHIAALAALQPPETIPADGFRYTKSETRYMSTGAESGRFYTVLQSTIREIWIARDGEGRLRTERVGDAEFLSEADKQAWEAAGSPSLARERVSDERFEGGDPGGTSLFFEEFDGLPTDSNQLYLEVEKRAQGRGPGLHPEMFVVVGDLLRETVAPPELRAALLRVAARIPGVEVTENVPDLKGRPGIAVSHSHDPGGGRRLKRQLIFDPETSMLLSEAEFVMEKTPLVGPQQMVARPIDAPTPAAPERDFYGDIAPGTQVGGAVYLESGTVDSVEKRP
jgi:hypothetical protein